MSHSGRVGARDPQLEGGDPAAAFPVEELAAGSRPARAMAARPARRHTPHEDWPRAPAHGGTPPGDHRDFFVAAAGGDGGRGERPTRAVRHALRPPGRPIRAVRRAGHGVRRAGGDRAPACVARRRVSGLRWALWPRVRARAIVRCRANRGAGRRFRAASGDRGRADGRCADRAGVAAAARLSAPRARMLGEPFGEYGLHERGVGAGTVIGDRLRVGRHERTFVLGVEETRAGPSGARA